MDKDIKKQIQNRNYEIDTNSVKPVRDENPSSRPEPSPKPPKKKKSK